VLRTALGQRPSVAVYGGDYPTPDGTCVRDYVHVADLADAHVGALRFLEERRASDRFNLGTGRGASVKNVLEAARRVTGRRIAADVVSRRPGDPPQLVADPTRAVETLGWRPKYPELEGQLVKEGDLLAEIDPRPYQAQLAQFEGQMARDQALLANARIDLERYRTLYAQDSIAKQQVDTQEALVRQYEGTLKVDQGQIDNARLQLTYSRVTAPISGRLGLRVV